MAKKAAFRGPLRSMRSSESFREFVLEQLAGVRGMRARAMFGGVGLYADAVFFGIVVADTLYFKVDDTNRRDYELAASHAFKPYDDYDHAVLQRAGRRAGGSRYLGALGDASGGRRGSREDQEAGQIAKGGQRREDNAGQDPRKTLTRPSLCEETEAPVALRFGLYFEVVSKRFRETATPTWPRCSAGSPRRDYRRFDIRVVRRSRGQVGPGRWNTLGTCRSGSGRGRMIASIREARLAQSPSKTQAVLRL